MNVERLRRYNYRQLFWKWHKYAGLLGGPLLMLIAVTGSILVFAPEIDHWLRPDLWTLPPTSSETTLAPVTEQSLIDGVRRAYPTETLVLYRQNQRGGEPHQYWFSTTGRGGFRHVWVNPRTGEIVGERMWESSFLRIVEQLHRRLLSGETGSSIIELITGWGIVLTLTGCFLWWPKTIKTLWHGLTLSLRGSAYKVNWRLHNTVGAWVSLFVLLMCLTGMVFSTYSGKLYFTLMNATGGSNRSGSERPRSVPMEGRGTIGMDDVLAVVWRDVADDAPLSVTLPRGPTDCITVTANQEARPLWSNRGGYRSWTFDQYSGALLSSSNWDDLHPMMKFARLSLTIHYGSIFGLPTKVIALLACLGVPVLSITGSLIWWWKRRGKQKIANRPLATAASRTERDSEPISKWLVASLIVVSVMFPTIGVSFVVLAMFEGLVAVWRRRRGKRERPGGPRSDAVEMADVQSQPV